MARGNTFRFATVLRVRERQEQLRAQSLAEVRRQIRSVTNEREQVAREQIRTIKEASQSTRDEFHGPDVHAYFQYERHLARLAVEKDATIRKLQQVEAERSEALAEATKRRRMIERLKERFIQVEQADRRKLDQKLTDEVAGIRAATDIQIGHEA